MAAMISIGCEEEGDPIKVDPDRTVEVFYVTTPPDTAEILNATAWDQAKEVSIRVGEEPLYGNSFAGRSSG